MSWYDKNRTRTRHPARACRKCCRTRTLAVGRDTEDSGLRASAANVCRARNSAHCCRHLLTKQKRAVGSLVWAPITTARQYFPLRIRTSCAASVSPPLGRLQRFPRTVGPSILQSRLWTWHSSADTVGCIPDRSRCSRCKQVEPPPLGFPSDNPGIKSFDVDVHDVQVKRLTSTAAAVLPATNPLPCRRPAGLPARWPHSPDVAGLQGLGDVLGIRLFLVRRCTGWRACHGRARRGPRRRRCAGTSCPPRSPPRPGTRSSYEWQGRERASQGEQDSSAAGEQWRRG
jgi:hypothetical protein